MKKSIVSACILASGLAFSAAANAATTPATLNVSLEVLPSCVVATTTVNFGSIPSNALMANSATGDVTVNCPQGFPYHIALDAGSYLLPGLGSRTMSGLVGYSLCHTSPSCSLPWGDADYANTYQWGSSLADTGNGNYQSHTVYGSLVFWNEVPGSYSDTVNVTVYY